MKKQAEWITCHGEAHSNAYIDNCWICMPYWGKYPVCPSCKSKITKSGKYNSFAEAQTGYCRNCRKFYILSEKQEVSVN